MINKSLALVCAACFGLGFASSALGASGGKTLTMPDFTKGDAIPADAKHDWNLSPTGARGWMFCDKMVTSDARQVKITTVDKGSPADGVLAVGDVLLGAGGRAFSFDPRTELG
ncbi:MAG: acetylesterase, partial [Verrucomicrobia bacterium]|nr:acetylesterase [Verrucomicrobiota bacterium]